VLRLGGAILAAVILGLVRVELVALAAGLIGCGAGAYAIWRVARVEQELHPLTEELQREAASVERTLNGG
jgi:hypothetical protein